MFRQQEKAILDAKSTLKAVEISLTKLLAFANDFKDPVNKLALTGDLIPGQDFTVLEVLIECQRTVRALKGIQITRLAHVPSSTWGTVGAAASQMLGSVQTFEGAVATVRAEGRVIRMHPGGVIRTTGTEETVADLASISVSLFQNLDALRSAALPIFNAKTDTGPEKEYDLVIGQIAESVAAKQTEAQTSAQEASAAKVSAESALEELRSRKTEFDTEAVSLRDQLSALVASADEARAQTEAAATIVSNHEIALGEKLAELVTLAEEGSTDRDKLAEFAEELEAIRTRLAATEQGATSAHEKQQAYLKDVQALIVKAEGMVSGATIAGLARAFGDERASLGKAMNGALIWFGIGIVFIFLVTLLLAAYVFELPIHIFGVQLSGAGATANLGDEITVAGVLSRTIILLAPFWLTLFSARRYRNLFDLRQQYSHKYNMAFSVDGFKQQAPTYSEQIAAWVFHVVAQSPITSKGGGGLGDNPLPNLQDIVSAPIDRFAKILQPDRKDDA